MSLTNYKFFVLVIISHLSLAYILIFGSWLQIITSFLIFVLITLFSSTILYHRYLSHRSWKPPRWYEIFAIILGIFSFTGSPITRTLAHRYHHAYTETNKDPHSPRVHGIFLSYFPMLKNEKLNPIFIKDLLHDNLYTFIHKNYLNIILITCCITFIFLGFNWTLSILIAPGALCWFNISLCNILCHWGKNNDPIKQNKLLAWITFGEGYHKHHHENPRDPDFGNGNYDPGYAVIKLISKLPN